mmetsp:Transcript_42100/g.51080  ORF Transcript_42100/g.51080 Transcript_42100/m.51080 type:complete len:378 (-) Transcript_42100:205-1338(-)|eukprot:CAMPEP_0197863170 /NCGR_PEP_ID=MMETSP1438-20131217/40450_1 /TAXON_ID=1461541 /ORGANISM="Pterosperma sp., Strain CCMP1384" /LENGTH=377 /DNA_ID=CAMNT_0043480977 /DNA_START=150 /DNA_END=1283 /DNA_ORIENTATION=+
MAGAGADFYMPACWPFPHLNRMLKIDPKAKQNPPKPKVVLSGWGMDAVGNLTSSLACSRNFLIACALIYYLPGYTGPLMDDLFTNPLPGNHQYPAFGAAAGGFDVRWMLPILARNLLGTWAICGFWDWILYFSPLKERLAPYKLNPKYPSNWRILHDAMMTTQASVCGTAVECFLCWLWATGRWSMSPNELWEQPLKNFICAITITHWRIPHFYFIHRGMHPWRPAKGSWIPDVGKFLYKHVHGLHHKSYNPTAFSGTNMHPVEATAYYTAGMIPLLWKGHPALCLGCILDCGIGAWLGHDGFQWPGSGDYFHQLHHAHFDCNYGAMHVPIDYWMGTYIGCKEDMNKVWGKETVKAIVKDINDQDIGEGAADINKLK